MCYKEVNIYTRIAALEKNKGYVEAVASCGLHNMTKEDNVSYYLD